MADVLPGGDPGLEVDVTFAPIAAGPAEAYLVVMGDGPTSLVPLHGTGVADEPTPSELIDDILTFFDGAVVDGTLVGSGPGRSAAGRLNALRNMLDSVRVLIDVGEVEQACLQLADAYRRTDGDVPPPDFVGGDAAPGLAALILELQALLGCGW